MPNNNNKVLVPRNRDFSNYVLADDVTEFAELDVACPPALPASVYVSTIVATLEKAGYKIIAAAVSKNPTSSKAKAFKAWLNKANVSDEARYALLMQDDEMGNSDYDNAHWIASWSKGYCPCVKTVIRFNTGSWRK
jgi:hypothetical protein